MYAAQTNHNAAARSTPAHPARARMAHEAEAGFEIFRRAILQRDEEAWLEISLRYRPMFISWALQVNTRSTDEQCDDIADRAFARAWAALSPERFVQFPNLSALLGYLRACVSATAIDAARSATARERAYQRIEPIACTTTEEEVIDKLARGDLWRTAIAAAHTEQERVVLIESFQLELPPRTILARHPGLFTDSNAVYMAKRHALSHLQRCADLRRFVEEA
jgi:DNA-directed RNA polymerase specialized sigma24 family protein